MNCFLINNKSYCDNISWNIALLAIASRFKKSGIDAEYYDLNFENKNDLLNLIKFKNPKFIFFSLTIADVIPIHNFCTEIKLINSDVFIVVGGPQAEILPKELLTHCPSFEPWPPYNLC